MTYEFLQHYWCFIVSLLGALLVFLLFVQGANSVARSLGQTVQFPAGLAGHDRDHVQGFVQDFDGVVFLSILDCHYRYIFSLRR